jgi:hypothetical protein
MVGGSFRVLRLLPPLKLVAMLKVPLNTNNKNKSIRKSASSAQWIIKSLILNVK